MKTEKKYMSASQTRLLKEKLRTAFERKLRVVRDKEIKKPAAVVQAERAINRLRKITSRHANKVWETTRKNESALRAAYNEVQIAVLFAEPEKALALVQKFENK